MSSKHLFHTEHYKGFDVNVYAHPEYDNPRDHFWASPENDEDIFRRIENGSLEWFAVEVTASKNGIELTREFLGGCCYENISDFIDPEDYFGDMRESAVQGAILAISKLAA